MDSTANSWNSSNCASAALSHSCGLACYSMKCASSAQFKAQIYVK